MRFENFTKEEIRICFNNIEKYLETFEQKWVKYIDLGCKTIRLISYSDKFLPLVEKQLTYVLKDSSDKYDSTLVIWNEKDPFEVGKTLSPKLNPKVNIRLRIDMLYSQEHIFDIQIYDKSISKAKPVIDVQSYRKFFLANDYEKNTFYYGVNNLEPEEFIKEGHIFVQFFNNILKSSKVNLAHGAVIGLNGNGILFCARGQRGKSTLSVLSMIKGFEYVSDDYLILHNKNEHLLSSPIYSIITLSPQMYNRLYKELEESQFVSNNARKDKYVFNISNFHDRFRKNYPIKLCIFPEIVSDKSPSILPCNFEEKGRAIVQLIQSTLMQTNDLSENHTVKKMLNMVKDFPFYKFNLCYDIEKNTEFLREFMNNIQNMELQTVSLPKICTDITFDLANILDSESGIIYSMNKFATNIFENLQKGVSVDLLKKEIAKLENLNPDIKREFDLFIDVLETKHILKPKYNPAAVMTLNADFAEKCGYKLSIIEYSDEKYSELINKENKNDKLQVK